MQTVPPRSAWTSAELTHLQPTLAVWLPRAKTAQSKVMYKPCGPARCRLMFATPLAMAFPSMRTTASRTGPEYPLPEHHPAALHHPGCYGSKITVPSPNSPSLPHAGGDGDDGGDGGSAQCAGLGSPIHGVHTPPKFAGFEASGSFCPWSWMLLSTKTKTCSRTSSLWRRAGSWLDRSFHSLGSASTSKSWTSDRESGAVHPCRRLWKLPRLGGTPS